MGEEMLMRTHGFAVSASLAGLVLLAGCSRSPGVTTVEPHIKTIWGDCNLVKVKDITKTSEKDLSSSLGKSYRIGITYTLEITQDISASDIWDLRSPDAAAPVMLEEKGTPEQEEAKRRVYQFMKANCPMTSGSNLKRAFWDKRDSALNKGETRNLSMDYLVSDEGSGWRTSVVSDTTSVNGEATKLQFRW